MERGAFLRIINKIMTADLLVLPIRAVMYEESINKRFYGQVCRL